MRLFLKLELRRKLMTESEGSGSLYQPVKAEKLINDMVKELERLDSEDKDKEKFDKLEQPRMSRELIKLAKSNLDKFIKEMTQRPSYIFGSNEKMQNTSDKTTKVVNTGIPALRGLIYVEKDMVKDGVQLKKGDFAYVNTCPGAGSCVLNCYATKGNYAFVDNVIKNLTQRLNFLVNDPKGYEQQAYNELKSIAQELKDESIGSEPITLTIRWNDAGDFFNDDYYNIAVNVTKMLKKEGYDVESYAYTKMGKYALLGDKDGIMMNFSTGSKKSEQDTVNDKLKNLKVSVEVPRKLFEASYAKGSDLVKKTKAYENSIKADEKALEKANADKNKKEEARLKEKITSEKKLLRQLRKEFNAEVKSGKYDDIDIFKKEGAHIKTGVNTGKPIFVNAEAPQKLKQRIVDFYDKHFGGKYKTSIERLKFTYEIEKLNPQIQKPYSYDLIVLPKGDSDVGANRRDVKISFLLSH